VQFGDDSFRDEEHLGDNEHLIAIGEVVVGHNAHIIHRGGGYRTMQGPHAVVIN